MRYGEGVHLERSHRGSLSVKLAKHAEPARAGEGRIHARQNPRELMANVDRHSVLQQQGYRLVPDVIPVGVRDHQPAERGEADTKGGKLFQEIPGGKAAINK